MNSFLLTDFKFNLDCSRKRCDILAEHCILIQINLKYKNLLWSKYNIDKNIKNQQNNKQDENHIRTCNHLISSISCNQN